MSIDEVETGLFLGKHKRAYPYAHAATAIPFVGNLTAATHMETLKTFKITHILTLDSVPLPQHIVDSSFLTTKYVQSKCRAAEGYDYIYVYIYLLLFPFQLPTCRERIYCSIWSPAWSS